MATFLVLRWLSLLVDVAAKSLVLLAAAGVFHLLLRRASAAARHLVWLLTIGSLLALPLLSTTLPQWRVRAWPQLLPLPPAVSRTVPRWLGLRPSTLSPAFPGLMEAGHEASARQQAAALQRVSRVDDRPLSLPGARPSSGGSARVTAVSPGLALMRATAWRARLSLPLGLFLLWLAGAGVVLGQVWAGMVWMRRLARRCRRVTEAALAALTAELSHALGLRRPIVLLLAPNDAGPIAPMTWGWRQPVVLLPADCHEWSESRLRSVLLHELAHVQRRDWPALLLNCVTCALYWFHPLVWLAARQLRIESERACDDRVLTAGVRPTDYASHLLEVVRSLRAGERSLRAALTMAPRPAIELRVRAILKQQDRRPAPRWALVPASLVMLGALVPLAAVRPGDKSAPGHGPGALVRLSIVIRRSASAQSRTPRRATLVAILEQRDRPSMWVHPSKQQPAAPPRKPVRRRPASPRAERHMRPDYPTAPRPRKRRLPPNRLLAALPEAAGPPAPGPNSPSPEAAPVPEPGTPAAADGAVLAASDESARPDSLDPPVTRDARDDGASSSSTVTFAVAAGSPPDEASRRWVAALQAGQIARPIAFYAAEAPDQMPEPRELELGPDTDVLSAAGQDRDAFSSPSDRETAAAVPSTGQAVPLEEVDSEPLSGDQALGGAGQGLTVAELLVWDRARQCWDRVLVVWDGGLASPAPVEEGTEGEGTLPPAAGSSPFEPGSLDEDLWFWDQLFQRSDQEPAGRSRPEDMDLPASPCLSSSV